MFSNWFKKKTEPMQEPVPPSEVTVYGTTWCAETRRCRSQLNSMGVPYVWVDIDKDMQGEAYVRQVNRGNRSVPTIVCKDGTVLVEPSESELAAALGTIPGRETD